MYQAVLVDDESFVLEGLALAIDWEGHGFEIALLETNPLLALEYIRVNPVHLLITDISMPQMTGIELMRACRQDHPQLSVLVVSAYDRFEYVREAMKQGAENYLLKPVDEDELSETVGMLAKRLNERARLVDRQAADLLPFRANFTEGWLKGNLTGGELRARAEMLGINVSAESYAVVLFFAPQGEATLLPRFFEHLKASAENKYELHGSFESIQRIACIFSPARQKDLQSFLDVLLKGAALLGLNISACGGESVHSAADVHKSYQSAGAMQFLQFSRRCIMTEQLALPAKLQAQIESPDAQTSPPEYINWLQALFYSGKHDPFALTCAVVRWCLKPLDGESVEFFQRFAQAEKMVKDMPQKGAGADEYFSFCARAVTESAQLLQIRSGAMYPVVQAVLEAVNELSDKDISLKTLSARLNVTPSYLGNVFHQQMGIYFNEYLTQARLTHAAKLIETTNMKIKDIVDEVGFSSQTYFNRAFKRQFALSPVAYRRRKLINQ
ncbi:MAG: helix-turn-helix domain-containing protein [Christensenellales bacterium]|jgi:two-component system response regulator YesN